MTRALLLAYALLLLAVWIAGGMSGWLLVAAGAIGFGFAVVLLVVEGERV